jgi:hypothetical protein
MWKSFFIKVFRFVALTLLIAQVTFSTALAQETPSSEAVTNQLPEALTPSQVKLPQANEPKADHRLASPSRKGKKAPVV